MDNFEENMKLQNEVENTYNRICVNCGKAFIVKNKIPFGICSECASKTNIFEND